MNFSDMKLQIINGVKWYFNRNWNRNDMMNFNEIPEQVHTTLMKNTRFLLSMLAAYSFGASVSAFPNYLFEIEQRIVLKLLTGITIGCGNLLCRAITTRKRSEIYRGCMKYCFVLPIYALVFIVLDKSGSALLVIKRLRDQNMDEISDEVHSTLKMNMRIVTSMLAAYSFGSSVGFIFNYLFKIEQLFVLRFFGWYKQLALEICCIKPSNQRIGGKSTPVAYNVVILNSLTLV
uniref:Uncharacterized protein n=1 Tax=Solanum tuberosum TaxID=4113 RepID=M1BGL9_SOLTU